VSAAGGVLSTVSVPPRRASGPAEQPGGDGAAFAQALEQLSRREAREPVREPREAVREPRSAGTAANTAATNRADAVVHRGGPSAQTAERGTPDAPDVGRAPLGEVGRGASPLELDQAPADRASAQSVTDPTVDGSSATRAGAVGAGLATPPPSSVVPRPSGASSLSESASVDVGAAPGGSIVAAATGPSSETSTAIGANGSGLAEAGHVTLGGSGAHGEATVGAEADTAAAMPGVGDEASAHPNGAAGSAATARSSDQATARAGGASVSGSVNAVHAADGAIATPQYSAIAESTGHGVVGGSADVSGASSFEAQAPLGNGAGGASVRATEAATDRAAAVGTTEHHDTAGFGGRTGGAGTAASATLRTADMPSPSAPSGTQPSTVPVTLAGANPAAPAQAPAGAPALHGTAAAAFAAQLSQPVLRLANTARGERAITVRVAPEDLGPVTVRAIVGSDGVRIELTSAGDAGREALRQVIGDLRRDLAATGSGATLDLGTGAGRDPGAGSDRAHDGRGASGASTTGADERRAEASAHPMRAATAPTWHPTSTTLDTLA
jgi:flagellar hook-length control protein FliK